MATPPSTSARQAAQLLASLSELRNGYFGDRLRAVLHGVTDKGTFVGGMTADAFHARASDILVEGGRIYQFGNSTVYETTGTDDARLTSIAVQGKAEPGAAAILANLMAVEVERDSGVTQSLLPPRLVGSIMADEALTRRLPRILHYSRRPCLDRAFHL
jgi:hypothetical protein